MAERRNTSWWIGLVLGLVALGVSGCSSNECDVDPMQVFVTRFEDGLRVQASGGGPVGYGPGVPVGYLPGGPGWGAPPGPGPYSWGAPAGGPWYADPRRPAPWVRWAGRPEARPLPPGWSSVTLPPSPDPWTVTPLAIDASGRPVPVVAQGVGAAVPHWNGGFGPGLLGM